MPSIANDLAKRSQPSSVIALLSLAFLLAIIDRMIFSLLIPPIKSDLNLTDAQAGELAGVAFGLFYMIMGLPLGRLADRVNRPRLICAGLVLWSLATATCAFATTFKGLFAARVLVGVGEAAISPAAYSLLADYVPKTKLARAMSIYMMGTVVGIAIAWIAGGKIISSLSGGGVSASLGGKPWSVVFIAAAAPGLLLAPLLLTIRETRDVGSHGARARVSVKAVWDQLLNGRGAYGAHFIAVGAVNTYGFALLTWTPTMFAREFNWPIGHAGPILGLVVGISGIAGMYAAAAFADRLTRRDRPDGAYRLMLYATLGMLPILCMTSLTHAPFERLWLFLAPQMTLFFMIIGCAPTALQMVTPAPLRGSISAVYLFVVNVIAFSVGPTFVGAVSDHYKSSATGLSSALQTAGLICVPIAAVALLVGSASFRRLAHGEDSVVRRQSAISTFGMRS